MTPKAPWATGHGAGQSSLPGPCSHPPEPSADPSARSRPTRCLPVAHAGTRSSCVRRVPTGLSSPAPSTPQTQSACPVGIWGPSDCTQEKDWKAVPGHHCARTAARLARDTHCDL